MDDIYENVDVYNANKNCKVLIVFDVEMITVMLSKKNIQPIATELFIRGRKTNISLFLIIKIYFAVPKKIRLHSTQ